MYTGSCIAKMLKGSLNHRCNGELQLKKKKKLFSFNFTFIVQIEPVKTKTNKKKNSAISFIYLIYSVSMTTPLRRFYIWSEAVRRSLPFSSCRKGAVRKTYVMTHRRQSGFTVLCPQSATFL